MTVPQSDTFDGFANSPCARCEPARPDFKEEWNRISNGKSLKSFLGEGWWSARAHEELAYSIERMFMVFANGIGHETKCRNEGIWGFRERGEGIGGEMKERIL